MYETESEKELQKYFLQVYKKGLLRAQSFVTVSASTTTPFLINISVQHLSAYQRQRVAPHTWKEPKQCFYISKNTETFKTYCTGGSLSTFSTHVLLPTLRFTPDTLCKIVKNQAYLFNQHPYVDLGYSLKVILPPECLFKDVRMQCFERNLKTKIQHAIFGLTHVASGQAIIF